MKNIARLCRLFVKRSVHFDRRIMVIKHAFATFVLFLCVMLRMSCCNHFHTLSSVVHFGGTCFVAHFIELKFDLAMAQPSAADTSTSSTSTDAQALVEATHQIESLTNDLAIANQSLADTQRSVTALTEQVQALNETSRERGDEISRLAAQLEASGEREQAAQEALTALKARVETQAQRETELTVKLRQANMLNLQLKQQMQQLQRPPQRLSSASYAKSTRPRISSTATTSPPATDSTASCTAAEQGPLSPAQATSRSLPCPPKHRQSLTGVFRRARFGGRGAGGLDYIQKEQKLLDKIKMEQNGTQGDRHETDSVLSGTVQHQPPLTSQMPLPPSSAPTRPSSSRHRIVPPIPSRGSRRRTSTNPTTTTTEAEDTASHSHSPHMRRPPSMYSN
eukprot:m.24399 g.24399  ORF g.24399 m.24399 type:complete len:394 (+) comp8591_c0_seq2:150-1331(+)